MWHQRKAFIDGVRAEQAFQRILEREGYSYSSGSRLSDTRDHWDFKLDDGRTIDVKRIKAKNRGQQPDEAINWIELKNVQGKTGWLYGKADLFAFETIDYFIIVSADALRDFISKRVIDKQVYDTKQLYKIYSRKGRKDQIVLVKNLDLCYLAESIILK